MTIAERAKKEGKTVLARVTGWGHAAREPRSSSPSPPRTRSKAAPGRRELRGADIDLFEINEAFAVVAMATNQLLGLDAKKVNVRGGAVVLGHPIGASGCRLVVTLLLCDEGLDKKRGVAVALHRGRRGHRAPGRAGDGMNKVIESAAAAVADVHDGAVIMSSGFGLCGNPENLIAAILAKGAKNLTVISNNCGTTELRPGRAAQDAADQEDDRQLRRREQGVRAAVPGQGDRGRADAAGHARRAHPRGRRRHRRVLHSHRRGHPDRARARRRACFDGREYVLETALKADFAIVRAWKADTMGNLVFRKTARNFAPMMCTAARVTICEAEQIVQPGELDPDQVHVPGIYVKRVVQGNTTVDREADIAQRDCAGPRSAARDEAQRMPLTREQIAARAAQELKDGST